MTRVSDKFRRMAELYRIFSKDWEQFYNYDETALEEMYRFETYGEPISPSNGYYIGKKWLNVTVTMWKEDIEQRLLFKIELYQDPKFPHWWLDSIFKV
jgi:hypothetical protein